MKNSFFKVEKQKFQEKFNKLSDFDEQQLQELSKIALEMYKINNTNGKANFLKSREEKEQFIKNIKNIENFNTLIGQPEVIKKLIGNGYFEFLLPYALSSEDFGEYKNMEILGVGYYDDNLDLLS